MAITKVLAGASLVLLALAAAPVAQAQNAGDGTTTVTRPHKVVDPATESAPARPSGQSAPEREQAARSMQQQQGSTPTTPSAALASN